MSLATQPFYDNWSRTLAGSWGTSDSLHDWSVYGDAADFSVDGTTGIISTSAVNSDRYALVNAATDEDVDLTATFHIDTAPVGAAYRVALMGRWVNSTTFVAGTLLLNPDGSITALIEKNGSALGSVTAPVTWTIGDQITLRFKANGTQGRVKVWLGAEEPTNWSLGVNTLTSPVGGPVGMLFRLSTGSSGVFPAGLHVDSAVFSALVPADQIVDTFTRSSGNSAFTSVAGSTFFTHTAVRGDLAYECRPTGTSTFSTVTWTETASVPRRNMRTYFRTNSNTATHLLFIAGYVGGGTNGFALRLNSTGKMEARDVGSNIFWTSTMTFAIDTFYRLEARYDSSGSKMCRVKIYDAAGALLEDSGEFANSTLSGNISYHSWGYVRLAEPTVIHDGLAIGTDWLGAFDSNHTAIVKQNDAELDVPAGTAVTTANTGSVTDGWDVSDSYHEWAVVSGNAVDYRTSGGSGVLAIEKEDSTPHLIETSGTSLANVRQTIDVALLETPSTSFSVGVYSRYQDASNYLRAVMRFTAAGQIDLVITEVIGGVETDVETALSAKAYVLGSSYTLRFESIGEVVRAKVYDTGSVPVATWPADGTTSVPEEAGAVGVYAYRAAATGNLIPNPSFEAGTTDWVGADGPITQTAATAPLPARTGSYYLSAVRTSGSGTLRAESYGATRATVVAGTTYSGSAYVRSASTARVVSAGIVWYDNLGAVISTSTGVAQTEETGRWIRPFVTAAAPVGAVSATIILTWTSAAEAHHVDQARIEAATSPLAGSSVAYIDSLSTVTLSPEIDVVFVDGEDNPYSTLTVFNAHNFSRTRVTRVYENVDIPESAVRGLDNVPVTTEALVVNDYEAALSEPFVYKLMTFNSDGQVTSVYQSEPVEIAVPWHTSILRSISEPTLSRRVQINEFPSFKQSMRVLTTAKVLGMRRPTVLYDTLGGITGEFTIMVPVEVGQDYTGREIRNLFNNGHPLLFQSVGRFTGVEDFCFIVTDVEARRATIVTDGEKPIYLYTVSFQEISAPPTDQLVPGVFTWQTLLDAGHLSWDSVNNSFSSWLQVLNFTSRDPVD